MSISVRFTPLAGVHSADAPLCYLLEIDSVCILLDCGWTEEFSQRDVAEVVKVASRVDAVIISHSTVAHVGALPYLIEHHGLRAQLYATLPVRKLGETTMLEHLSLKQACSDFNLFEKDDVLAAFSPNRWCTLTFQEEYRMSGKAAAAAAGGKGITITPYVAGCSLGGAVWRIRVGGEDIVYGVGYNHRKTGLLSETTFPRVFKRPALFINDARTALVKQFDRKGEAEKLLASVQRTLERSGTALLPVDASAARTLELAHMLDEAWAQRRINKPLVWVCETGAKALSYACTLLQYCHPNVSNVYAKQKTSPFNFQRLRMVSSVAELHQSYPGPKIVLAPSLSLEQGPARQLFVELAMNQANAILFTERAPAGSLADTLMRWPQNIVPLSVKIALASREALEGEELQAWQAAQAAAAEAREEEAGRMAVDTPSQGTDGLAGPGGLSPASSIKLSSLLGGDSSLLPLRASSGSISRLVRDAATGLVVQRLDMGQGPATPGLLPAAGSSASGAAGMAARVSRLGSVPGSGTDVMMGVHAVEAVLMDGFKPPQGAAGPMFPDEDEWMHEEWDEYGAPIHKEDFMVSLDSHRRVGIDPNNSAMDTDRAASGGNGGGAHDDDDADADVVEEVPTKLMVETKMLTLTKGRDSMGRDAGKETADIRFYDCEGRADRDALHRLLASVAPQRLVLVHGSQHANQDLGAALHAQPELQGLQLHTYTPGPGESLELSLPRSEDVQLSAAMEAHLRWGSTVGSAYKDKRDSHGAVSEAYKVAWLEGRLVAPDPSHPSQLQVVPLVNAPAALTLPAPVTAPNIFISHANTGVSIARVRKDLVSKEQMDAQMGKQRLTACQGQLTVTQGESDQHLVLDGAACPEYYRVREVLYSQFGTC